MKKFKALEIIQKRWLHTISDLPEGVAIFNLRTFKIEYRSKRILKIFNPSKYLRGQKDAMARGLLDE